MSSKIHLLGYHLTTAEITYRLPDYPELLQNFIWQDHDMIPHFPTLRKFLAYWQRNLDGQIHSVKIATAQLIKPNEFRFADSELVLH